MIALLMKLIIGCLILAIANIAVMIKIIWLDKK